MKIFFLLSNDESVNLIKCSNIGKSKSLISSQEIFDPRVRLISLIYKKACKLLTTC